MIPEITATCNNCRKKTTFSDEDPSRIRIHHDELTISPNRDGCTKCGHRGFTINTIRTTKNQIRTKCPKCKHEYHTNYSVERRTVHDWDIEEK